MTISTGVPFITTRLPAITSLSTIWGLQTTGSTIHVSILCYRSFADTSFQSGLKQNGCPMGQQTFLISETPQRLLGSKCECTLILSTIQMYFHIIRWPFLAQIAWKWPTSELLECGKTRMPGWHSKLEFTNLLAQNLLWSQGNLTKQKRGKDCYPSNKKDHS